MSRHFSPAKINLFLDVLSKRRDGFHSLVTLFERISLKDELIFKKRPHGIKLTTTQKGLSTGPKNLIVRAAALLRSECGVREGVEIRLIKHIPVAAGLGGGSSNAATTLLALNQLWKLGLSKKRLLSLGAQLGSDVPFFVLDRSWALARGRGERLSALSIRHRLWHCIVKPPFGISTREAYEAFSRRSLTPPRTDAKMLVRSLQKGDLRALSRNLSNSLEVTLNKRVTEISELKKSMLAAGALSTLMSGSGSCVFGLFETEAKARKAGKILRKKNRRWKVFVAATF